MILCVTVGPLLCYRKKAMFSMILVIFNFLIFFVMFLAIYFDSDWPNMLDEIYSNFGFAPNYLIGENAKFIGTIDYTPFSVGTIFTHMFIHSYFSFFHILMNMVFLLFLGMPFEEKVGPWKFMTIYFVAGVFASLFTAGFAFYSGGVSPSAPPAPYSVSWAHSLQRIRARRSCSR